MINENIKMKNYNKRIDISERFLDFGVNIIGVVSKLNNNQVSNHITNQLMRSATSAGANYEEACGAESKKDFIHKMQLVLKELRETLFWLKLLKKSKLISTKNIEEVLIEADELVKIIAKSLITAKKKTK